MWLWALGPREEMSASEKGTGREATLTHGGRRAGGGGSQGDDNAAGKHAAKDAESG